MNVRWTQTARGHLRAIRAYIAQASPKHAAGMAERLMRRARQIAEFPLSGRQVPEYCAPQVREIIEGPYRIIYHIEPDELTILAIVHAARDIRPKEPT
jgi:plasmid stabilization system protein ParE